jgi:hypothetical protein
MRIFWACVLIVVAGASALFWLNASMWAFGPSDFSPTAGTIFFVLMWVALLALGFGVLLLHDNL